MNNIAKNAFLEILEKKAQIDQAQMELSSLFEHYVELLSPIKIGDIVNNDDGRLLKIYLIKIKEVFDNQIKVTAYGHFQKIDGTFGKQFGSVSRYVNLEDL